MTHTDPGLTVRPEETKERRRQSWPRFKAWFKKSGASLLAVSVVASGLILTAPAPKAEALTFGAGLSIPGFSTPIGSFVLPDGRRVFCVEATFPNPGNWVSSLGILGELPGRAGAFPSFGDPASIRQMSYIVDVYGQTAHAGNAAGAQVAIWALRNEPSWGATVAPRLQGSEQGRELLAHASAIIADAKKNAKAPTKPNAVSGKLTIDEDPSGRQGRFKISYPKGTTKLSVKNAKFVRNNAAALDVDPSSASARYVDIINPKLTVEATGHWSVKGAKGWDANVEVFASRTDTGVDAQKLIFGKGKTNEVKGTFQDQAKILPRVVGPAAESLAQPSAEVGGTMQDTLIVRQTQEGELQMWPGAVASFTAYLRPEEGAVKVDQNWDPVLGAPYEVQAEDATSGDLIWSTWWAAADGTPLLDAAGAKIPTTDASGAMTAGQAADGTPFPVQGVDEHGDPAVDQNGDPVYLTGRDPVMEERRDPVRWTAAELAGMTDAQQCVAQPIYTEGGISVPGLGRYSTQAVPVKSTGTVHWVERIVDNTGRAVHVGKCGISNETTKIGAPGVMTQAVPEAVLGDEIHDVATVSGTLAADVDYELRFDAYTAPEVDDSAPVDPDAPVTPVAPVCAAENRIFRSSMVPVNGVGDYASPSFTVGLDHGTTIWWVESLYIVPKDGSDRQLIHRGECGLENETTRVSLPTFETKALETAAAGDELFDTIIASDGFATNAGAVWEASFTGYRAAYEEIENQAENVAPGAEKVNAPVCAADNKLFETDKITLAGPGEHRSPGVIGDVAWAGPIWWVETVTLTQDGKTTTFHTGECGLANETTQLTAPKVVTKATGFAVVGDEMSDTATITGPLSERDGVAHEVVFEGYRGNAAQTGTADATCTTENRLFVTEPVPVPAEAEDIGGVLTRQVVSPGVRALPEMGDTVWWVEKLIQTEGSESRQLSEGACGLPNETTNVTAPTVRTESAGTVSIGDDMFDTAIVDGRFPTAEDVEFFVTFQAFDHSKGVVCSTETELTDFADQTGVKVDKPGKYESKKVKTKTEHVGIGGYVETLVMRTDESEHVVAIGKCGEASEKFEILPPAMPPTGGGGLPWWIPAGAGVLVLGGAAAIAYTLLRRKVLADASVRDCGDASDN